MFKSLKHNFWNFRNMHLFVLTVKEESFEIFVVIKCLWLHLNFSIDYCFGELSMLILAIHIDLFQIIALVILAFACASILLRIIIELNSVHIHFKSYETEVRSVISDASVPINQNFSSWIDSLSFIVIVNMQTDRK